MPEGVASPSPLPGPALLNRIGSRGSSDTFAISRPIDMTVKETVAVSAERMSSRPGPRGKGIFGATISVVMPALNEADNLPYVLPRIPEWVDEVVLVDGRSTDDTVKTALALYPSVRIVRQKGRGKGAALLSGFEAATGDIIVTLDADGSTDPAHIPAFVGALLAGADFAKGSRFICGAGTSDMPLYRRMGNGAFVMLVRLLFGVRFSDLCYGYNAFWARVLPRLKLDGSGFEIETMMNVRAQRAGLKITEVAAFEYKRVHGDGRLRTIPDGWRVLKTILRERLSQRGSHKSPETTGAVPQEAVPTPQKALVNASAAQPWPHASKSAGDPVWSPVHYIETRGPAEDRVV